MKKFLIISSMLLIVSCASIGVWSDSAKEDISTFVSWADKWVGGAIDTSTVIISAVESVKGTTAETTLAKNVLLTAASALTSLHSTVEVGNDATLDKEKVVEAIKDVSTTIGKVQELIN
jgi:hypothetical protein